MLSMQSRSLQACSSTRAASSCSSNQLAAKCSSWRYRLHTCSKQNVAPQAAAAAAARDFSCSSSSRSDAAGCKRAVSTAAAPAAAAGPAAAAAAVLPAVGAELIVCCERLGVGGVGVCLLGPSRLVLLVRGALPGETLVAKITAVKKGYAEGLKICSLTPHNNTALPMCQHYGTCGGCSLQAMQYSAQLHHKALHIEQLLRRAGKFSAEAVQAARLEPVAAEAGQQYWYRNKVQLAFSSKVWIEDDAANTRTAADGQAVVGIGAVGGWQADIEVAAAAGLQAGREVAAGVGAVRGAQADTEVAAAAAAAAAAGVVRPGRVVDAWGLGFYLPGSSSVVMPVEQCSLVAPQVNQLIAAVAKLCQQQQLQPHNPATGCGVLRHLIVRCSSAAPAPPAAAAAAAGVKPAAAAAAAAGVGPAAAVAAGPQLMAVLVSTSGCKSAALQPVAAALMAEVPGLVSVVHSIEAETDSGTAAAAAAGDADQGGGDRLAASSLGNSSQSAPSAGRQQKGRGNTQKQKQKRRKTGGKQQQQRGARALAVASSTVLAGAPHLVETLSGLQFHVSPHSFFQTNTRQAELLYEEVLQAVQQYYAAAAAAGTDAVAAAVPAAGGASEAAASTGSSSRSSSTVLQRQSAKLSGTVLDLYCGTGTISLLLASRLAGACRRVVGFDVSASAIADARANAARNLVTNVQFVCGDLTQLAQGKLLGPDSLAAAGGPDSLAAAQLAQGQLLGPDGSNSLALAQSPGSSSSSSASATCVDGPDGPDSLANVSGPESLAAAGGPDSLAAAQLAQGELLGPDGPDSLACARSPDGSSTDGLDSQARTGSSSNTRASSSSSSGPDSLTRRQACQPDVVVVDPARAGLSRSVVDYLLRCGAQRVVYVSCNAATQARDLQLLCGGADAVGGGGGACFRLVSWRGVDMFPQTDHLETVAVLDRC